MIVLLYRWKVKTGKEKQFADSWAKISAALAGTENNLS